MAQIETTRQIRIKSRVDNSSTWTSLNPVLLEREIGYEKDTGKYKIGDGETAWNNLEYVPIYNISEVDAKINDEAIAKINELNIENGTGKGSLQQKGSSQAIGTGSHAEGYKTIAEGNYSHTEGANTIATTFEAHAEGYYTQANGDYSHVEGQNSIVGINGYKITGYNSEKNVFFLEGTFNTDQGDEKYAVGDVYGIYQNTSNNPIFIYDNSSSTANNLVLKIANIEEDIENNEIYVTAEPFDLNIELQAQFFDLIDNINFLDEENPPYFFVKEKPNIASTTIKSRTSGHAEGYNTMAIGGVAHSEGGATIASGNYSHAEGWGTKATSFQAHAEGYSTQATQQGAHSEGRQTKANGKYSHAEGHQTRATEIGSHAEGEYTQAGLRGILYTAYDSDTLEPYDKDNYFENIEKEETRLILQKSGKYGYNFVGNLLVTGVNSTTHRITFDTDQFIENKTYLIHSLISSEEGDIINEIGHSAHAEGYETIAISRDSHAEGHRTVANGFHSHAEGSGTVANGSGSHAEGDYSKAIGYSSHAEGGDTVANGDSSHAEGYYTQANGDSSHAEGYGTIANGENSHAEGYRTITSENQHAQGHFNKEPTAADSEGTSGTAFIIGNGTSSKSSNAFRVTYAGKPYALNTMSSSGADYAEFFEWLDLNPNSDDRRGYFVTLEGDKIKIANSNDYILGVVSALPAIVGNGDEDWKGRYILDDFGDFITEKFEYQEKVVDKKTGEVNTIIKTGTKYKENPDYDPSKPYIQREDRPEWDPVGMLGVLAVRDDGTCIVNGYCQVSNEGIATHSEKKEDYRVIKRINDHIIQIVFR